MNTLVDKLREALYLDGQYLIGCRRRNSWSDSDWRTIRGNALLALLGEKRGIHLPDGQYFEYFGVDNFILQFRGGTFHDYWMEDFKDVWSLAEAHRNPFDQYEPFSRSIILVQEDQGRLNIQPIQIPESVDAAERAASVLSGWAAEPPDRISKADARAFRVCLHCPHRKRCDAQDILDNATHDWSDSYRKLNK